MHLYDANLSMWQSVSMDFFTAINYEKEIMYIK